MEKSLDYSKNIPIILETDILVIGGSQSGVAAAVSAKRANKNAKVTLIEQYGYLGGQSVGVMVCHYEFREYTNNKGQILAKGFGKELIERTVAKGHSDPLYWEWLEGRGPPFPNVPDGRAFGDIPLDVEDLKLTMQEMCDEVGVEVLLFTKFVDVITSSGSSHYLRPEIAIIANSEGLSAIRAKIMIDCSANNDVAARISPKHVIKPQSEVMPMQTYAWLGGVDIESFINAIWDHRDWWLFTYPEDKNQMLDHMRQGKTMVIRGGANYLDIADEKFPGILESIEKYCSPIIYYWLKPVKIFPCRIHGKITYESWWAIEGPVSFEDQTDPIAVSKFAQKQLHAIHLLQKVHSVLPGWEKCYVVRTSDRVGFRRTRVFNGLYTITEKDVKEGVLQPDVIGRGSGHDISRFHQEYEFGYDIPYRALIPAEIDGLLVGARSISCDPNESTLVALNAHRGISATMIVSQAAGVAAALCIEKNIQPREINIQALQEHLQAQDVVLKAPKK
jgi:hypothetical protein